MVLLLDRSTEYPALVSSLTETGYAFVPAAEMAPMLAKRGFRDFENFAASWDDLGLDRYMADGGRYRRRRHGMFRFSGDRVRRLPDRPHFQTVDNNPLNGGIARHFQPIEPEIASHPAFISLLLFSKEIVACHAASYGAAAWQAEVHQFRIEADAAMAGKPSPEGVHRDGVDFVFVMLVRRENIAGGETVVADCNRKPVVSHTLARPLDSIFLDDRRVLHGVSEIRPLAGTVPSFRDVLVITFRKG